MPFFVRLANFTEQGSRQTKDLAKLLAHAKQVIEANGARMVQAYATLGRYDLVTVIEAPDEKAMAKISALIASQGNFKAESLPAIPIQDFVQSVQGG